MLEQTLEGGVSVDRGQTLVALLRLTTAASVFWLALQLSRRALRAHLLLEAVAVIIAAYAAYGLVLSAFFSAAIPFFDAPAQGLFVRSTFVNRNNFATYAGLGLMTTLALIVPLADRDAPTRPGSRAYRLAKRIEAAGLRGWLLLAAGFVIFVALLGTVSRGGILAAMLGACALLAVAHARGRRRGESAGAIALVLAGLGATILFFGDLIVGRLLASGLDDGSRLAVFSITLRAILDTPLLGYGYGVFADVFPLYRDRSIPTEDIWDKAHNAYLEVFLGLGLVFGTALVGALVWLAAKCFIGAASRRSGARAGRGGGRLLAARRRPCSRRFRRSDRGRGPHLHGHTRRRGRPGRELAPLPLRPAPGSRKKHSMLKRLDTQRDAAPAEAARRLRPTGLCQFRLAAMEADRRRDGAVPPRRRGRDRRGRRRSTPPRRSCCSIRARRKPAGRTRS